MDGMGMNYEGWPNFAVMKRKKIENPRRLVESGGCFQCSNMAESDQATKKIDEAIPVTSVP